MTTPPRISAVLLLFLPAALSLGIADEPPRAAPSPPGPDDVAALEARVRGLEAELARRSKGSAPATPSAALPDVKALMGHLADLDGLAMWSDMERLILAGEPGFSVLHQFLHEADIDHPKILQLTHDAQMIFAMLRIVAQRPDETATLCKYLIHATRPRPESFIRREIYNFLPVFLNYHPGKYADVRKDLEEDILYQLEKGGEYSYKVFIAMRDLDFSPPAEKFLPLLKNPSFRDLHSPLIQYLGGRKAEGLKVLLQHVIEAPDPQHASVRDALLQIAAMDAEGGPAALLPLCEHPNLALRSGAMRAYFNHTRSPDSLPLVVKYLNSPDDIKQKRVFVNLLDRKNSKLLEQLRADPGGVTEPQARELLTKKTQAKPTERTP